VRAGIKYCGGCRASFDRKAEAESVMQAAPDVSFSDAADGAHYDILISVCGCSSRCADISPYSADKIIYIYEAGAAGEAAEAITATMEDRDERQ